MTNSWNADADRQSGAVTARNIVLERHHPARRQRVVRLPGHAQRHQPDPDRLDLNGSACPLPSFRDQGVLSSRSGRP